MVVVGKHKIYKYYMEVILEVEIKEVNHHLLGKVFEVSYYQIYPEEEVRDTVKGLNTFYTDTIKEAMKDTVEKTGIRKSDWEWSIRNDEVEEVF